MSRTISFELKFDSNKKISAITLLETLINFDWSPIQNGLINYLPIDDNEMYNWTKKKISISDLYEIVYMREQSHEVIGVDLYWNNTDVGVSLLIFNPYEISFGIDINRKYIDEKAQLIDFNWYATKILLGLNNVFNIAQYKFSFTY